MKPVRCAIYTRKSSDEGLEQDFNSLDAQREACAAYILSQASEGWTLLPAHYDDGGISGGTLERPALQRLLADVASGLIDIIVVYKVDRLTRSLLDFARLVEALDKAGTSFVSITQSFNTTTSMGRLTLNMLLSFAQFEREVTAERIRDKLAASKAKGMWMGGTPPLGYKPDGRSLVVVEKHAAVVRDIYARYQSLRNVRLVADQLASEGIKSPLRRTATGKAYGGAQFSRGQICFLLKNPIYVGDIPHHGKAYPGMHEGIIPRDEWEAVQALLASHVQGRRQGERKASAAPLAGLLVDGSGEPLIATHTCKGKRRYRYYVSKGLHHGTASDPAAGLRIPAAEIEQIIANELATLFDDPLELAAKANLDLHPQNLQRVMGRSKEIAGQLRASGLAAGTGLLVRVAVHEARIDFVLSASGIGNLLDVPVLPCAADEILASSSVRLTRTGRAVRLVHDSGAHACADEPDVALIALVLKAREWWTVLSQGEMGPVDLARARGVSLSYVTRVVRLAFLAPRVVDAIVSGGLKAGIDGTLLMRKGAIPDDWQEQHELFLAG